MSVNNRFEDRLLEQLRSVVAERPSPAPAPARPRRARGRARLALAGAGLAAAVAAIAVAAGGGGVASPAYAVQSAPNGSVTVHISSLSDAAGLQGKLRAAGVPAVVSYSAKPPENCVQPKGADVLRTRRAPERSFHEAGRSERGPVVAGQSGNGLPPLGDPPPDARHKLLAGVRITPDGATFTVDPGHIASGEHLYITTTDGTFKSIAMGIGRTPTLMCPPPPPPAAG
jgi:hypothetical protein